MIASGSTKYYNSTTSSSLIHIYEPVKQALEEGRPVVALESTIVAHGMPYPQNLQLSQSLARILRERGVEPATIAVHRGTCKIGLSPEELHDLAAQSQNNTPSTKLTTRELPLFLGDTRGKEWGATTVASTMRLAHMAGISTFVTGGIGGVHRGVEQTMDISADLIELARTPVIVVSAGVKSILDIPRTLENLETNGVPVLTFRTDEFPAFFSPSSGVRSPWRVDQAASIAKMYQVSRDLGLPNGMLVAVPSEIKEGNEIEDAIQLALREAATKGITGKDITPFILSRVSELTQGESLKVNMKLVEENARIGAEIAVAVSQSFQGSSNFTRGSELMIPCMKPPTSTHVESRPTSRVIVMGAVIVDFVAKPVPGHELVPKTSNPCICLESDGGVARNIAEALGRLGSSPMLFSAVGSDSRGYSVLQRLKDPCGVVGVDSTISVSKDHSTATYLAVLESDGELHTACADVSILSQIQVPDEKAIKDAEIIAMDANSPLEIAVETALLASKNETKVFFEPTCVPKAILFGKNPAFMASLTYVSPNVDELAALADGWTSNDLDLEVMTHDDEKLVLSLVKSLSKIVLERMNPNEAHVIVTAGHHGVLLASRRSGQSYPEFTHLPVQEKLPVLNSTGAGDSLAGGFIHALLHGRTVVEAAQFGMEAASLSVVSQQAISPELNNLKLFQ